MEEEESKALKANTVKFPFLIGKVLTVYMVLGLLAARKFPFLISKVLTFDVGKYDTCSHACVYCYANNTFPFLIGKVLTNKHQFKQKCNHRVSIPYR